MDTRSTYQRARALVMSPRASSPEPAPQVTAPPPLSIDTSLETDRAEPSDARFAELEAKQDAKMALLFQTHFATMMAAGAGGANTAWLPGAALNAAIMVAKWV